MLPDEKKRPAFYFTNKLTLLQLMGLLALLGIVITLLFNYFFP